jgi:NAD(P)-dependent dehydrogenase (short-subunit alcohol dehydrogenase family)
MTDRAGRTALVTGASRGTGRAVAVAVAWPDLARR